MNSNMNTDDSKRLSNDDLWKKAGSSQPITRSDLGLKDNGDGRGLRQIREGLNILKYNDESGQIYKGTDDE